MRYLNCKNKPALYKEKIRAVENEKYRVLTNWLT